MRQVLVQKYGLKLVSVFNIQCIGNRKGGFGCFPPSDQVNPFVIPPVIMLIILLSPQ